MRGVLGREGNAAPSSFGVRPLGGRGKLAQIILEQLVERRVVQSRGVPKDGLHSVGRRVDRPGWIGRGAVHAFGRLLGIGSKEQAREISTGRGIGAFGPRRLHVYDAHFGRTKPTPRSGQQQPAQEAAEHNIARRQALFQRFYYRPVAFRAGWMEMAAVLLRCGSHRSILCGELVPRKRGIFDCSCRFFSLPL
jgi:hypothetical protein